MGWSCHVFPPLSEFQNVICLFVVAHLSLCLLELRWLQKCSLGLGLDVGNYCGWSQFSRDPKNNGVQWDPLNSPGQLWVVTRNLLWSGHLSEPVNDTRGSQRTLTPTSSQLNPSPLEKARRHPMWELHWTWGEFFTGILLVRTPLGLCAYKYEYAIANVLWTMLS